MCFKKVASQEVCNQFVYKVFWFVCVKSNSNRQYLHLILRSVPVFGLFYKNTHASFVSWGIRPQKSSWSKNKAKACKTQTKSRWQRLKPKQDCSKKKRSQERSRQGNRLLFCRVFAIVLPDLFCFAGIFDEAAFKSIASNSAACLSHVDAYIKYN